MCTVPQVLELLVNEISGSLHSWHRTASCDSALLSLLYALNAWNVPLPIRQTGERKSLTKVMFPFGKLKCFEVLSSQGSLLTDLTGSMLFCPPKTSFNFCILLWLMPSFIQICWHLLVWAPDFFQTFIILVFFPGKHLAVFPALQGAFDMYRPREKK